VTLRAVVKLFTARFTRDPEVAGSVSITWIAVSVSRR
jgi:hypothetical protein